MKKFFMVAVMAIVALTANAQKGEYYVTPKVNFGYAVFSNKEGNMDINGGLFGDLGVDFEYMLADQFGLSAGVGFKYFESDKVDNVKLKASYLEIPVMANYHAGNFAVKAGLKTAFKTSLKWDIADGLADINISSVGKSVVLYVPVGVSYRFGDTELGLNCDIPCTQMENGGMKMMPIYLSVGYRF